ncbi:MAG: DUF1186 domain-containing protein [Chloroflexi bacterium]|nr:DUF1186 domain-containing protein [Chloroflexota bacterium]
MADTLKSALEALLDEGEELSNAARDRVKTFGSVAIPPLIEMATSDELNHAPSDEPRVYAPLHAIEILGDLRATQAIEPLLPLVAWDDDDWLDHTLPEFFAKVGEPAIAPLEQILADNSKTIHTHARASQSLVKIAQEHSEHRARVITILTQYLKPEHTQTPDHETRAGFIIGDLCDLQATEALPAIRRAFAEDRVDPQVVDLDHVEREMRGEPLVSSEQDLDVLTAKREKEPLSLMLKCTQCGRERRHQIPVLFVDFGTVERHKRKEKTKYDEFVIPQRITCPKCGAVDQYELTALAHLSLTLDLVTRKECGKTLQRNEGNIRYVRFAMTDGREMHPREAMDLLRDQVARNPKDADLRVRYANVLRLLGYLDEAIAELTAALELDPNQFEAQMNLGRIHGVRGDFVNAQNALQRAMQLLPTWRKYAPMMRQASAIEIADHLEKIARQEKLAPAIMYETPLPLTPSPAPNRPSSKQPAVRADSPRLGRNDPCFCGSGKKYKQCHGR